MDRTASVITFLVLSITIIAVSISPIGSQAASESVTAPYLMAFHACDIASIADCHNPQNHRVYLAQSDDGENWSLLPGWQPFSGSVPDVIRRGDTLYIYTPGRIPCEHSDRRVSERTDDLPVQPYG